MGSCFSSSSTTATTFVGPPTTKIITIQGSLREYSSPVTASDVLGANHLSHFLCDSDKLSFDRVIPAIPLKRFLETDQIYFVLPIAKLERPLSGADMAALAVKASNAIASASGNRWGRTIRVAPLCEKARDDEYEKLYYKHKGMGNSRTVSSGKRMIVAHPRRSYRTALSTIEE